MRHTNNMAQSSPYLADSSSNVADAALPTVSIVMPIRNEAGVILKSVTSVLGQEYPAELMQILVVDGMSEDGTRDILLKMNQQRQLEGHSFPEILVLDNPRCIAPTAMNVGIQKATGEIIVRVDGHAILEPTYIRQCVDWLQKTGVECVGGAVTSVGSTYVGKAIAAAMSSRFGVGGSGFRTADGESQTRLTDTVPFGAFKREVFSRVGLFNETMVRHQDYEFNYRLRKAGGRILLLPFLRVEYHVRSQLRSLWKQYWQYGIWKGRFIRTYPDSLKFRHLVPALFVFILLLSAVIGLVFPSLLWCLGTVLGAYALFLILAIVNLSRNGNLKFVPLLPIVLVCLHVSYGLGIWIGLLSPGSLKPSTQD